MPIHDWTRALPGDFHHFHHDWITFLAGGLNRGRLPPGYVAMAEQVTGRPVPDVVALETRSTAKPPAPGGVAVADAPPQVRHVTRLERTTYTRKANRVAIRHVRGRVVAVVEIVSPGNKDSRHAIRSFVEKAADMLDQGVHLLVVDLFPPTPRDPQGIHKAIWDELCDEPFELPPDKPLTVAAYVGGDVKEAYVEPVGVGDPLPEMPIFLTPDRYVPCPLEASYQQAWELFPDELRDVFTTPGA